MASQNKKFRPDFPTEERCSGHLRPYHPFLCSSPERFVWVCIGVLIDIKIDGGVEFQSQLKFPMRTSVTISEQMSMGKG
jgi:hypothetical protein